jgi:hypothetical protein
MDSFEQWWDRVGSHENPDASGSTARQAWHAALEQYHNHKTDDTEVLSDWEKTRNGEMLFKTFADKWMPYLPERE